ncbi:MAG: hypothetical protein H7255_02445 [Ramlibacter sp.]|nr:hypothetical protein [Ramlibacter sp.]
MKKMHVIADALPVNGGPRGLRVKPAMTNTLPVIADPLLVIADPLFVIADSIRNPRHTSSSQLINNNFLESLYA